jgi:hypothetical protein
VLKRRNFRREMEDVFMAELERRLWPRATVSQGSIVSSAFCGRGDTRET